MTDALAHCGPDGRKFAIEGLAGIGQCSMRVTHEDQFDAQPLRDRAAGITLVADLRLDNREGLGATLGVGAADLRDMPDSALLLRAYTKWGENCAEHLLGDFAFAIWDGRGAKLVLGRDHMGQRAIFYYRHNDFLIFASDAKALYTPRPAAAHIHRRPDRPRADARHGAAPRRERRDQRHRRRDGDDDRRRWRAQAAPLLGA
ncbi:MAG: hypothetical protein WBD71_08695, partial [Xanthobacteraceae bacterium]